MFKRSEPQPVKMSLGDHLEELRWRIFKAMIGPLIFGLGMIFIADKIVSIICQPLMYELAREGWPTSMAYRAIGSPFGVFVQVCIAGGVIIGIPWILWQMWLFISPGLHKHERRFVVLLLPGSAVLAVLGVLFMYFFMLPLSIWFFLSFTDVFPMPSLEPTVVQKYMLGDEGTTPPPKDGVENNGPPIQLNVPVTREDPAKPAEGQVWFNSQDKMLKLSANNQLWVVQFQPHSMIQPILEFDEYISFVMWLGLSFAAVFQLPLLMLLAGWIGVVDRRTMAKGRKAAILLAFIVGAMITPGGSPVAQIATALPMYALYELGMLLMWLFVKRKTSIWSQWDDAGAE